MGQIANFIKIKGSLPGIRGRIMSIPGGDITTYDTQGNVLAKGFSIKVTNSRQVQPDRSRAPHTETDFEVTRVGADGKRIKYSCTVPALRFVEDFFSVIRDAVGADAEFDETEEYSKLLLVTLGASEKDSQSLAPTYETNSWVEGSYLYYEGVCVCNSPVEISREYTNADTGITMYRVMTPSLINPGFMDYASVTQAELDSGNLRLANVSVSNGIKTSWSLKAKWEHLSPNDKSAQEHAERSQPDRIAKQKIDRQWGFRNSEGR